MTTKKFKVGDYVFVKDKHGATQSTKVWGVTAKRVIVENWERGEDEYGYWRAASRYVSPDRVVLQSDWAKENGAETDSSNSD